MIAVRLMGGLGNQMFEYAAAKRLALHHNTDLKLDMTWFDMQEGNDVTRRYELDCFALKAKTASASELPVTASKRLPVLAQRVFNKLRPSPLNIINEKAYGFDTAVLDAPDNSLLVGYWQTEKYFADAADAIRADFAFASKPSGKNAELAKQIAAVNAISLHVRRGDYVSSAAASKFHGLAPLDYYREAIKAMAGRVKDPHFFVISDDPAWCKENIKLDYPATYIDHNGDKGFEDMRLMTLCRHHIIANSSFSWWGAWLNPSKDKIVYAPKRWFADPEQNKLAGDVIPKGWNQL